MGTLHPLSTSPDIAAEDYLVVGLATCFVKDAGELQPVSIIEPIPSAALEAIAKGIPTSYERVSATTVGDVLQNGQPQLVPGFPTDAHFCDEFALRAIAAARTYKARPTAQAIVPIGTTRTDFNFSTERKRILNAERLVKAEDNVKQHSYTHQVL